MPASYSMTDPGTSMPPQQGGAMAPGPMGPGMGPGKAGKKPAGKQGPGGGMGSAFPGQTGGGPWYGGAQPNFPDRSQNNMPWLDTGPQYMAKQTGTPPPGGWGSKTGSSGAEAPPGLAPGIGSPFNTTGNLPPAGTPQTTTADRLPPRPEIPPIDPNNPNNPAPPGTQPAVQPPSSIYDVYETGRARMQEDANRGIEQAMATAGFGGNRYGSSAMHAAGEEQRRHELPFQQQWTDMLYNQGQSDLNRQLQAAQFGMGHNLDLQRLALDSQLGQGRLGLDAGTQYEQMMMDRIRQMFGMGAAETGRSDDWNRLAYDEFMQSRFGFLPMLLNAMGGQPTGGGSPGSITTGGGGSNFWSQIMPFLPGLFGQ